MKDGIEDERNSKQKKKPKPVSFIK